MNLHSNFLYPRSLYHTQFELESLAFNAQLQDFSQRVNYICSLQTGSKLSSKEAHHQIHILWKKLKMTRKHLSSH